MKISVIIPAYNAEKTINDAIQSVRNQQYQDYEIIVVDDRSTDGTVDTILANHVEPFGPAKLFQMDVNSGPALTRNKAITNSTGQYILPLDADDMIRPDYLQKTVPLMEAGVGIVSTGMQYFGIESAHIQIKNRTYQAQLQSNEIPVTSLIDREAILQAGGYKDGISGWEDWMLSLDILSRRWRMASINQPLFLYRRRHDHLGSKAWDHKIEYTEKIRLLHPQFLLGQI